MPARPVRRLLPFAALAAATALVLSACAAPGSDGEGGELVWSIEGANLSAGHMDPQVSQLDVSGMVQRAVLDSLVFQEADGTFSPWLAKSWEVSPDSTEYTFVLRDDVTFTDGEKFDAAAVKANFDRIVDPETASAQAASMLGADFYEGTEVVDDYTVTVTFTQPYAPFLQAASTPQLGFYSPAVLAKSADKLKAGDPTSPSVPVRSSSPSTRRTRRSCTPATTTMRGVRMMRRPRSSRRCVWRSSRKPRSARAW